LSDQGRPVPLKVKIGNEGRPIGLCQEQLPGADPGIQLGGRDGERFARAYNGVLGAEPPAGSRGRAPGQGVRGQALLKLKDIHFFDAQRRAKFGLLSRISR